MTLLFKMINFPCIHDVPNVFLGQSFLSNQNDRYEHKKEEKYIDKPALT